MDSGGQQTHLYTYGAGRFSIHKYGAGSAAGEVFSIVPNGNIGIGTANPLAKLQVKGTDVGISLMNNAGNQNYYVGIKDSDGNKLYIGRGKDPSQGVLPAMVVDATDRVGIGTTAPSSLLHVNGTFTATSKNFQIDHPLEPEKKHLVHSALEGPEVAVYYRGEAQLENGEVSIALPSYFETLTRTENRTVQLTPIDGWAPLFIVGGVKEGKMTVRTANGGDHSQRFYWEVKAVRADVDTLVVERIKEAENQRLADNQILNPKVKLTEETLL